MRGLYWIRNDFRIYNNTALFNAVKQFKDGIVAFFFITIDLWRKRGYGKAKIDFTLGTLNSYADDLLKLNISLIIKHANSEVSLPIFEYSLYCNNSQVPDYPNRID